MRFRWSSLALCAIVVLAIASLPLVRYKLHHAPIRLLGTLHSTCAEDVVGYGKKAYIADGPGGLVVVDCSDPSKPVVEKTIPTTYAFRVAVYDKYLYLCDGPGGLKVYTLENPSDPVSTFSMSTQWASGMTFCNGWLYLADYYSGFQVYDVKNPRHPSLMAERSDSKAKGIASEGKTLTVDDNNFGLRIYSLDTPDSPEQVYSCTDQPGDYGDIVCHKGHAMAARSDTDSYLGVFDLRDISNVTYVKELTPVSFIEGMTIWGDLVLVACGEDGVIAYDFSRPADPKELWRTPATGYARRATTTGTLMYVAELDGISIYDIHGAKGVAE